jgi:hypothetical protein
MATGFCETAGSGVLALRSGVNLTPSARIEVF